MTVLWAELASDVGSTRRSSGPSRPRPEDAARHGGRALRRDRARARRRRADGVFGAPVAHEDDAERAVRAALRICDWRLATRAGVASGEALVALGGPDEGRRRAATSAAAALQRAAPPAASRSTRPRAPRPTTRCASSDRRAARPGALPAQAAAPRARRASSGASASSRAARAARATPSRRPPAAGRRSSARPGSASRRLLDELSRARGGRHRRASTAAAAWPTGRASPTGRCARSCGRRPRPARRRRRRRRGKLTALVERRCSATRRAPSGAARRRWRPAPGIDAAGSPLAGRGAGVGRARRSGSRGRASLSALAARAPTLVAIEDLH